VGPFRDGLDYNWQRVKCNVDLLKVIQIGLTFSNHDGQYPHENGQQFSTFQFNFHFDLALDLYSTDAIQFLTSNGIDFSLHASRGVDVSRFGELLMSSGVVLNDAVLWLSFQGKYDFAYLVKVLICEHLPVKWENFDELLTTYFPNYLDLKWLLAAAASKDDLASTPAAGGTADDPLVRAVKDKGLEDLAQSLGICREGQAHQAGSDSLLTCKAFFALRSRCFPSLNLTQNPQHTAANLKNVLHGLGRGFIRVERDAVMKPLILNPSVNAMEIATSRPPTAPQLPQPQSFPPLSGAIRLSAAATAAGGGGGRIAVQE
jgi:CCR4-NOT transcription complex subunit 7/8